MVGHLAASVRTSCNEETRNCIVEPRLATQRESREGKKEGKRREEGRGGKEGEKEGGKMEGGRKEERRERGKEEGRGEHTNGKRVSVGIQKQCDNNYYYFSGTGVLAHTSRSVGEDVTEVGRHPGRNSVNKAVFRHKCT